MQRTSMLAVFTTAAAAWAVPASLATAAVLTVGSGGDYADFGAAFSDAVSGDTIRFVDSATYNQSVQYFLGGKNNLTIESAPGQQATIHFLDGDGFFSGFYTNSNGLTLSNLNITSARDTPILTYGGGNGLTITGVNFASLAERATATTAIVETVENTTISYSTFRGYAPQGSGGVGVSWSGGTIATINHSSFDSLYVPIWNPYGAESNTQLTLTNSAFGQWYEAPAGWSGAIVNTGGDPTLNEDYNASYGPLALIEPDGIQSPNFNSGGHSFTVGAYGNIFVGDTSAGNWQVHPNLYFAAGDGTTIGAWQIPEPGMTSLLAVAAVFGLSRRRVIA